MENVAVKCILFENKMRKSTSTEYRFLRVMEREEKTL